MQGIKRMCHYSTQQRSMFNLIKHWLFSASMFRKQYYCPRVLSSSTHLLNSPQILNTMCGKQGALDEIATRLSGILKLATGGVAKAMTPTRDFNWTLAY